MILKKPSHNSTAQFCKLGEFSRQSRYGFTTILVRTKSPSRAHRLGAGAVVSGPARTDRRRAVGAGPRDLLPAAARCLSLASPAPGRTAHATRVKRRCRTHDSLDHGVGHLASVLVRRPGPGVEQARSARTKKF